MILLKSIIKFKKYCENNGLDDKKEFRRVLDCLIDSNCLTYSEGTYKLNEKIITQYICYYIDLLEV